MNQQPHTQPGLSRTQVALQKRLSAVALPIGAVLLLAAVALLVVGDSSTVVFAYFALGAALVLGSTQRHWKRAAPAVDEPENPGIAPR